jgi:hypothetical protein
MPCDRLALISHLTTCLQSPPWSNLPERCFHGPMRRILIAEAQSNFNAMEVYIFANASTSAS